MARDALITHTALLAGHPLSTYQALLARDPRPGDPLRAGLTLRASGAGQSRDALRASGTRSGQPLGTRDPLESSGAGEARHAPQTRLALPLSSSGPLGTRRSSWTRTATLGAWCSSQTLGARRPLGALDEDVYGLGYVNVVGHTYTSWMPRPIRRTNWMGRMIVSFP